jgi:hypothetical protein
VVYTDHQGTTDTDENVMTTDIDQNTAEIDAATETTTDIDLEIANVVTDIVTNEAQEHHPYHHHLNAADQQLQDEAGLSSGISGQT